MREWEEGNGISLVIFVQYLYNLKCATVRASGQLKMRIYSSLWFQSAQIFLCGVLNVRDHTIILCSQALHLNRTSSLWPRNWGMAMTQNIRESILKWRCCVYALRFSVRGRALKNEESGIGINSTYHATYYYGEKDQWPRGGWMCALETRVMAIT